jgi:DHA3 family macrolide efflux protein-like MFS transporter
MSEQNGDQPHNWAAPFFIVWSGQAFSLLGSSLVQFALIWWLTSTTGSATVLATAALVGLLPQVLLGPIAGALVDRWNRRVTMIIADSLIALAVVILAILFYLKRIEIWHIFLLMFFRSLMGGFHYTAMAASTSLMVPKEHLARVQGLNQMLMGGINIASAPLGALLLGILPMQGILAIDVSTAIIAILPLLLIAIPQPVRQPSVEVADGKTTLWQDLRSGFRYAFSWPGLVMIGLMAVVINLLLTPAFTLVPILVTKYFGGQALQIAWMESAWGIGVITGGLILSAWGGFRRRILTSLMGLIVMGIVTVVIGLLPPGGLMVAVAMMLLMGMFNPIVNGPLMAAVQAIVAPEMQGRVFTLIGSVASAMTPLGLIVAGPIADQFGTQIWFIIGGVVTFMMGMGAFFVPAVMNFEEGRGEASKPEASALVSSIGE